MAGEGFPFWMELTAADRLMTSLPLFHINAPAYSVMGSLACGAGLILLPRFSAHDFLDAARRHGATEFNAIGAMLEILMRQPERPDDAGTPLRLCYTGPAPERERQEQIEARFGLRIVVGYAMSESPYGLIWPRGTRPYGTLGAVRQHPVLGTVNEARVIGPDGGDLPAGATGELLIRNPVITPGYWGMPAETAEVITEDGWLHTGDLVTAGPGGMYTFVSRVKEVIRRRGENLSPLEVEEVLAGAPRGTRVRGDRRAVRADRGRGEGVPGRRGGRPAGLRRAARVRVRPARRVQGAALLAAGQRAAPDADRAGGQAPPARGAPAGGVRRAAPGGAAVADGSAAPGARIFRNTVPGARAA